MHAGCASTVGMDKTGQLHVMPASISLPQLNTSPDAEKAAAGVEAGVKLREHDTSAGMTWSWLVLKKQRKNMEGE